MLAKFEKSLVAVEASARAGAWGVLASGLEKATAASLPAGVAAPLRAVREESGRLTDLRNLRAAITSRRSFVCRTSGAATARQPTTVSKASKREDLSS